MTKRINVFAVHGVTVTGPYAELCEVALEQGADVPEGTFRVTEGRWPSTGGFKQDVGMLLMSRSFRERAVQSVCDALEDFERWPGFLVLMGHSMGQPLLFEALRRRPVEAPVITLGGPAFHRVWGPVLRTAGLGRPPPGQRVVHVWNNEDPICGSRPSHPSWVEAHRISLPVATRVEEHDPVLYLSHPLVGSMVLEAGGGRPK